MSTQVISVANKLQRIRDSYIKQLPTQLETLRKAYDDLCQGPLESEGLEDLHRRIHTIKGASASFGLSGVSAAAATGEHLAKEAMEAEELPKDWHYRMSECLKAIDAEASKITSSQDVDLNTLELVAATESSKGKETKVVYLCEDDSFQRLTMATQIGCFGFEVVSFADLEQFSQAVQNSPPAAIVMDLVFPDRPVGGAEAIQKLRSGQDFTIPTIFISSHDELPFRLAAARAGSDAYFVKPVNLTILCSTLSVLTSTEQPEPYRVMIVDDDPHLTELYATILTSAGMVTRTLNDPLLAMPLLIEFKPDLILSDMNMPGCNGIELARAIRQIDAYSGIPIVFLSSETDSDLPFHAMRVGGDEFLSKPIKADHLISAVSARAGRMKTIRLSMIQDSMTGLLNHTNFRERLGQAIAETRNSKEKLCFAMIDLDGFKQINDSHGHPTGDRVLIAMARFLQQRCRKTDIIGRYGSNEFGVILPDCDIATARSLLDQLRESFAAIRFPAGGDAFSATFSCGIAELSPQGSAEDLYKSVDDALSEAKNGWPQ
ncbi:putative 76.5 kDa protein in phbC 3'region [Geobacter sp. OR-1]|uniref:response regulator n=1 Tax=Geobacter sp. OR-1 TaxID=1266765 RepID=UPI00054448F7|nr:response regulator [Geobacter sp. OR-1]GAM09092.1 putative 76.5 kDa protein in phbC 3'region [Geobacter sp. OR-1]